MQKKELKVFLDGLGTYPVPMLGMKTLLERLREPDAGGHNIRFLEVQDVYMPPNQQEPDLQFKYCPVIGCVLIRTKSQVGDIPLAMDFETLRLYLNAICFGLER